MAAVIFIIIPSFVFYHIESGWSYLDSLYFTLISLNTVGFGDFTSSHHGYEDFSGYMLNEKLGGWVWAYRTFTLVWLVFGLGFLAMMNTLILNRVVRNSKNFEGHKNSSSKDTTTDLWNNNNLNNPCRRRSSV